MMNAPDLYVFIRKDDNEGPFVLHTGQSGPASAVFGALLAALVDESATGEWSHAHAHVKVSGRTLRSMLTDIKLSVSGWQQDHEPDPAIFGQRIADDAEYMINAVRV